QTTSEQVQQLKRASELSFRFKGNKTQYDFNADIVEKLGRAENCLKEDDGGSAKSLVTEVIADVKTRNKLIRLVADKSDAGWTAVDEYLSDELASDSEDDKRIRQAQARAVRKKRLQKSSQLANKRQRQNATVEQFSPSTSGTRLFRSFQPNRRFMPGATSAWSAGPKPTDLCFACGKPGHWRRNCG
ncbi:uncharacterized protein LOC119741284, partial [Patiria miniata]|uniref:CCHC-type domain-containing protein n=1 Tax=Patiria miniata TaxID=46514 RepID=A0A914BA45_PATMI